MSKSDNIGFESLQKLVEINKCKSPNNIRRIIISPEGVCVYYYVNVPTACKQFSVLDSKQKFIHRSPNNFYRRDYCADNFYVR